VSEPDTILIDDPFSDVTPPEKYLEWWRSVSDGRAPAGGKIIVIEGRRHESDKPGHVMGSTDWPFLVLPP